MVARTSVGGVADRTTSEPFAVVDRSSDSEAGEHDVSLMPDETVFVGSGCHRTVNTRRYVLPSLLAGGLAIAVGVVLAIAYRGSRQQVAEAGTSMSASFYGAITPIEKHLASRFTDADGDMLADPPTDPAMCVNPETLFVAHYEGDYEEEPRVNWEAFQAHLEAATGKRVVLQEYLHSAAEVESIVAGRIHIVAPHAADMPILVNNAGLVPVAALGTADGPNGNHMVIAVRPDSQIKSLSDLAGKTVTCTRPLSITGYRAAVTVLFQQAAMRIDADYHVYLTDGQARSIRGLTARWYEVVALSHDKLLWAMDKGIIDMSHYRTVYESEIIPRLTVGHIYNLDPQLAAEVESAILSFDNERVTGEEWSARPMRFYPVDYRRDFRFVRKMDDSFVPRCGKLVAAKLGM